MVVFTDAQAEWDQIFGLKWARQTWNFIDFVDISTYLLQHLQNHRCFRFSRYF